MHRILENDELWNRISGGKAPSSLNQADVSAKKLPEEVVEEGIRVLKDGYTVPEPFYNSIKTTIEEIVPALISGIEYTAEMLCGPDFWQSLNRGEPSLAGRCVMDMVDNSTLPLRPVVCQHEYPKRYSLK